MLFRTDNPAPNRPVRTTFTQRLASWREAREPVGSGWFDGGVHCVDARLKECDRLLNAARSAVADLPIGDCGEHLAAINELSRDREALAGLRDDLLNGATHREDPVTRTAGREQLSDRDRRWVTLEAARFFADQDDRPARSELAERARRHADVATSTLPVARSRALTAAFVHQVTGLDHRASRPRVAAAPSSPPTNLPGELLFLSD